LIIEFQTLSTRRRNVAVEYKQLGRTGREVGIAGLGCGGNSRLGQAAGKTEKESVDLVRAALDLGVNFLDTAAAYGTETIVGKAIKAVARDRVLVSTKALIKQDDELLTADAIIASLEQSLRRLDTDYVDVFHLHAVPPAAYDYVMYELVPALLQQKQQGKLRHLGITESPPSDPGQLMLQRAVQDDCWEVMMLGFHMLNQKARSKVFPYTRQQGIGTLLMFVVRSIFSIPGRLQATMKTLVEEGRVPHELGETDDPLGFLVHDGGADSVIDAAYRFARHEPGSDVVLFGTGDSAHLQTNIGSILKPPLPQQDVQKLYDLFGDLEGIGLDLPINRH
jgi:aryl-alcohol dehydrogenase-like predicted oxidoreductase